MARRFLGKGWRFPILPDATGRLAYSAGEANIEHSLKVLLLTNLGERPMRYEFGSQAQQLVFAPGGERHLRLLETSIREAIRDWEPRVKVDDVRVEADVDEPHRVTVSIDYVVRAANTRANLVFPYYLDLIETP